MATCPNLAPVHSFLSSYNSKPSSGHMKAALHVLHYIHSTHDHGVHFTSSVMDPIHTFVHFPDSLDVEAYTDAKPPSPSHSSPLTSYSNVCWGSQIGLAISDSTLLPLFKCHSMSGGIIFCQGGPIAWIAVHQERTSLSSCKAEIAPQTRSLNYWWASAILMTVFGTTATIFWIIPVLHLSTTTMSPVWDGLTI